MQMEKTQSKTTHTRTRGRRRKKERTEDYMKKKKATDNESKYDSSTYGIKASELINNKILPLVHAILANHLLHVLILQPRGSRNTTFGKQASSTMTTTPYLI